MFFERLQSAHEASRKSVTPLKGSKASDAGDDEREDERTPAETTRTGPAELKNPAEAKRGGGSGTASSLSQHGVDFERAYPGVVAAAAAAAQARRDSDDSDSEDDENILHKVSEYLFDLFDANCMDGYKQIDAFENECLPAFDPDEDEYTFEQQRMHERFVELFERLCEDYLKEEGFTNERFYDEVRRAMAMEAGGRGRGRGGQDKENANEAVEVMHQVADFTVWADEMRERAARRRRYASSRK